MHTADDHSPAITETNDGKIWLVWHSDRDENDDLFNDDLFYSTSDDGGLTWSADTQLTVHTGNDRYPAIAQMADGKVWVVWYGCRPHCQVWYKTSSDGGTTWSQEARLTQGFSIAYPAIAQTPDGRVWVRGTHIRIPIPPALATPTSSTSSATTMGPTGPRTSGSPTTLAMTGTQVSHPSPPVTLA